MPLISFCHCRFCISLQEKMVRSYFYLECGLEMNKSMKTLKTVSVVNKWYQDRILGYLLIQSGIIIGWYRSCYHNCIHAVKTAWMQLWMQMLIKLLQAPVTVSTTAASMQSRLIRRDHKTLLFGRKLSFKSLLQRSRTNFTVCQKW